MKILVLGAGGVGGYFGGRLAASGADVTFLVRPARAEKMKQEGLVIESPNGDLRMPVKTVTADTLSGPADIVVLTAKHYDLDAAITAIRPAVGPGTAVLPLLNGLAHLDRLDAEFGAEKVLGGVAYIGATLTRDGVVKHLNRVHGLAFGERHGGLSDRVRALADIFAKVPVDARASENILQDMWEKFVLISTLAGMTCLMRGTVGDIMAAAEGSGVMTAMLAEAESIAAASGYPVRPKWHEQNLGALTQKGSRNAASMMRDLESGTRTEGEAIIGDLLRRARQLGLATPVLQVAACALEVHEARLASERRAAAA